MTKAKKPKGGLSELTLGIFNVLEASNHGFFPIHAKSKKGIAELFYETDSGNERFLGVDIRRQTLTFYDSPKSYAVETACRNLASTLEKKGYRTEGCDSFIEQPLFRPDEISLY